MRMLAALSLLLLSNAAAHAAEFTSTYTDYDLKTCKLIYETDEGPSAAYACKGLGDLGIHFLEGDLRGMIAFGKHGENHCAARQSFGSFNSPNPKVEWRLRNGKPFAVIQRWFVSDPEESEKSYSWLVVTKLEPDNSCRVAIVEGALPDANQKARDAADTLAPVFDCMKDATKVISAAPMEIGQMMWGTPCPLD